jgi:hypothetical protein
MEFDTAASFGCNSNHVIINKSRLQNHLETTQKDLCHNYGLKKKRKERGIFVDRGHTFDNPPENNAKEKSAC